MANLSGAPDLTMSGQNSRSSPSHSGLWLSAWSRFLLGAESSSLSCQALSLSADSSHRFGPKYCRSRQRKMDSRSEPLAPPPLEDPAAAAAAAAAAEEPEAAAAAAAAAATASAAATDLSLSVERLDGEKDAGW